MKRILLFLIAILMLSCTTSAETADVDTEADVPEIDDAAIRNMLDSVGEDVIGSVIFASGELRIDGAGTWAVIDNPDSKSRTVYAITNPDDFDFSAFEGQTITIEAELVSSSSPFAKRVKVVSIK